MLASSYLAWLLAQRTAYVLLQRLPSERWQELNRAVRSVLLLDGVLEVQHEHFWSHVPGELVGSLLVRTRPGAAREGVLASARAALTPLVSDLTIHLEPAAALPHFRFAEGD